MYKSTVLIVALVALVASCQRKSTPTASVTPERYAKADIDAGLIIYSNGKCVRCHAAKPVENWTEQQWQSILKSMIPKAKLDSVQSAQVIAYVNTHAKK